MPIESHSAPPDTISVVIPAWNAAGTLRCWGSNDRGHIGDGTLTGRWAPVTTLADGVEAVWTGRQNVFARMGDGALLGWGAGDEGNLGAESSGTLTRPTPLFADVASAVREVVAGRGHTCILLEGGRVRCLGEGRYVAGDHRDTPSIQGAMFSGRRCGAAVVADLTA